MKNKKEIKNIVREQFNRDQEEKKRRKEQLKSMTGEERKVAVKEDRVAAKAAKKARKEEISKLDKKERKVARKKEKYYKKLKTRPRRYTTWGVVGILVIFLAVQFGPMVGDVGALLKIDVKSGTEEAEKALLYGDTLAEAISDEGIVLIQNEDNTLPLKDMKVNVFGLSSLNFRLGGGGSGSSDQSRSVDFYQGLKSAGISYNENLYDVYGTMGAEEEKSSGLGQILSAFTGGGGVKEPSIDYLTQDLIDEAKSYSDQAVIVLTNTSVEASDAKVEDLRLSKEQSDLIDTVADAFSKVIIIVNAGNARELAFIEEYPSIKATLWVGTPGPKGAVSLGKVLTGEVNPSGRLVDTYVYDIEKHPAIANFGDYDYTNIEGMSFLNYEESIYVGYRFFETYYEGDEEGYKETVQFPFGYGLSYTSFEWEVTGETMNLDEIELEVEVTNTGDEAGKDVVEVYFSAPYTAGGIEKSSIELAGYAKTKRLEPGESETVTISYGTREMASYDMKDNEAYVLEEGTYEVHVSRNVHEHMESMNFEVEETVVYSEDEVTGTTIENQFDYANGDLTYLSRDDWDGSYPDVSTRVFEADQSVVDAFHDEPEIVEGQEPVTGKENGILLRDLKGLSYDDAKWQDYLDQFTIKEMSTLFNNGGYRTVGIERLGLPETVLLDGPAGISFFFKATTAASYPTEVVIASTWNDELAYQWGEAIGKEANILGVHGWYAPAVNVHRSPLGGRNFEYFSEDPLLSGKMGAAAVRGAQSQNILVFVKHFALNEQEVNARSGIMVWSDEQAIREIYLKPFEITVKEGQATGMMSSFIHIGPKWAGGNEELLKNVLRDEWGFRGIVSTDAVLGGFMDTNLAVRNGNELMLNPLPTSRERGMKDLYKKDPVGIATGLRERTHNIAYTLLNHTNALE